MNKLSEEQLNSIKYFWNEFDYLKDISFDYCKTKNPYTIDILCKDKNDFNLKIDSLDLMQKVLWDNHLKIPKINNDFLQLYENLPNEIRKIDFIETMGMKKNSPHDYFNLEKLNLIYESGLFEKITDNFTILEFGNTTSGLSCYIKKLFPNVSYWCLDYPRLLRYTSAYLTTVLKDFEHIIVYPNIIENKNKAIHYISNFLLEELSLKNIKFDLVLNFLSLSEMPNDELDFSINLISKIIKDKGYFLSNDWKSEEFCHYDMCNEIGKKFNYNKEIEIKNQTHGKCNLWWNFSNVVFVKINNNV